ncbi:MAG TPA: YbjQ family protein [Pyrinomonadaceae bacterium]|nr:YbjQ family protein [Pyrinomonadaceae bacterium]
MNNDALQKSVPYEISAPQYTVSSHMVTTAFEIPGFRVVRSLGVVRGIVVRSRNLLVNIGAVFNSMVGGNITAWTRLCEETRAEAFRIMVQHASELGANAIVGARYDATEVASGASEVLAYGTAVVVEPADGGAGLYGS